MPNRLSRLQIDNKVDLGELLYRKIGRLFAFQDATLQAMQAGRNRSELISPRSNLDRRTPSTRLANSRARLFMRRCMGSWRRSLPRFRIGARSQIFGAPSQDLLASVD